MSGAELGLAAAVFLACAVEAVEALTIVLAVGTTRSWSSALSGVGAAVVALAAIVAALGPALTALPIGVLRLIVGVMLSSFGMFWGAEGAGAFWPGSDAALLALIPTFAFASLAMVAVMRPSAAGIAGDPGDRDLLVGIPAVATDAAVVVDRVS